LHAGLLWSRIADLRDRTKTPLERGNLWQRQRFSNEARWQLLPLHYETQSMKLSFSSSQVGSRIATLFLVLVSVGLGGIGAWLLVHDRAELRHESELRHTQTSLDTKVNELDASMTRLDDQIAVQQERVTQSERVIRQLEGLQSTWDTFIRNRAQQKANAERMKEMRSTHENAVEQVSDLQQQRAKLNWERESLLAERTKVASRMRLVEIEKGSDTYWIRQFWLQLRGWLCIAIAAIPLVIAFRLRRRTTSSSIDPDVQRVPLS
jgi:myosin heavy subunit